MLCGHVIPHRSSVSGIVSILNILNELKFTYFLATALIRKLVGFTERDFQIFPVFQNNHFTDWLYAERIKAFYCGVANLSLRSGVQCLLQTVGLGKMQPNILLLGSFLKLFCTMDYIDIIQTRKTKKELF